MKTSILFIIILLSFFFIACNEENSKINEDESVNIGNYTLSISSSDSLHVMDILAGYVGYYDSTLTIYGCNPIQYLEMSSGDKFCKLEIATSGGLKKIILKYYDAVEEEECVEKITCPGCNDGCIVEVALGVGTVCNDDACGQSESCPKTYTTEVGLVGVFKDNGHSVLQTVGYPNFLESEILN